MKKLALIVAVSFPMLSFASSNLLQCGAFRLDLIPESLFKINGETVTSQKIKILGDQENGMKIDMGLMPARDGNNYGFQFIHPPGSAHRWLNVQILQASMNAPRVIGSFPCKRVADQSESTP